MLAQESISVRDDAARFGHRMREVARRAGLICLNKQREPSGAWMSIDHGVRLSRRRKAGALTRLFARKRPSNSQIPHSTGQRPGDGIRVWESYRAMARLPLLIPLRSMRYKMTKMF